MKIVLVCVMNIFVSWIESQSKKFLLIFFAETLRKHPVAGSATRIATKPFKVPNTDYTIPEGMRVIIPIFGIHHDERFFPDPEEFNPEREFPKNEFLPFGGGMF